MPHLIDGRQFLLYFSSQYLGDLELASQIHY